MECEKELCPFCHQAKDIGIVMDMCFHTICVKCHVFKRDALCPICVQPVTKKMFREIERNPERSWAKWC